VNRYAENERDGDKAIKMTIKYDDVDLAVSVQTSLTSTHSLLSHCQKPAKGERSTSKTDTSIEDFGQFSGLGHSSDGLMNSLEQYSVRGLERSELG